MMPDRRTRREGRPLMRQFAKSTAAAGPEWQLWGENTERMCSQGHEERRGGEKVKMAIRGLNLEDHKTAAALEPGTW